MKTKIKRHSRTALSVVLAVCMLVSCMTVGIIATDAAKTADQRVGAKADDEALGATAYYLWYATNNSISSSNNYTCAGEMSSLGGSKYYQSFTAPNGNNIAFFVSTSNSSMGTGLDSDLNVDSIGSNSSKVTYDSAKFNSPGTQDFYSGGTHIYAVRTSVKQSSSMTVYVTYDRSGSPHKYDITASVPSGGGTDHSGETWTVAGSSVTLFTNAWSPSTSSNKMTYSSTDSLFVWEKNNVSLTADDDFSFKVVKGSDWGEEYPANNYEQAVDSAGTYDVKITFDPETKGVVCTLTESAIPHDVTFTSSQTGGTIKVDNKTTSPVSVNEGTNFTVTLTPSNGYNVKTFTVGGVDKKSNLTKSGSNYTYTQAMGNSDIEVLATFTNKFTLSKGSETNGTFTLTPAAGLVTSNTAVTVNCTPNTGYKVSTVKYGTATATKVTDNQWTFNMPTADTTVNVTFAKKDNAITTSANPGGSGTVWVASSDSSSTPKANFQVGDTVYLRANPNDAYTFSKFVVTYANGDTADVTTNNSSITIPAAKFNTTTNDGSISVVGYFTKKPTYDIIVGTSNRSLGTAVASVSEAYQGQSVTVEVVENTGTYSSYTVKDSSNNNVTASKSGNIISFTMPNKAVTISVTFTTYSANSSFYYNGYTLSGNNNQTATRKSGYYGQRMTEGKIGGEKYSYYHVSGRTEADQAFTISYGNVDYTNAWVYFQVNKNWDKSGGWGANEGQAVMFLSSDDVMIQDWTSMTWDSDDINGYKQWKALIPDGARYAYFKGETNGHWTKRVDLNNGTNGFTLQSSTDSGDSNRHYVNGWQNNDGLGSVGDVFENFNGTNKYTNAFSSGGFNNHNAALGGTHAFNKPNNLSSGQRGDYYIIVLYENKTYTINGVTKKVTKNPEVIWMPKLPSATSDTDISVYAKDGAIRNNDGYGPYTTLAKIADTALSSTVRRDGANASISVTDHSYQTANPGVDSSANDQDYQTATVDPGDIITVTTTINASNKDKYYVKGFIVNGETKAVCQWNSSGVYTFTYEVTGEERNHKVEITPVYFLKDDTNTINFSIDGFEPDLQFNSADGKAKWGDTIYVYPFYSYNGSFITGRKNAFGSYPGQPMVFDGGKYYIQIPKSISYTPDGSATAVTATVSGVTMSNGYWDHVHRSVMGWPDNHNELHRQTYDYDDFYKIANELSPDNITYEFKYRTAAENRKISTSNTYSSFNTSTTFKNGFDDLKDIYGRPIDIFGNLLNETEQGYSPVYVVSKGYKVTNAGSYATEWEIFYPDQEAAGATTWTKAVSGDVSSINPSALTLKNAARFATYGDSDFSKYKDLYTALDSEAKVKKQPVKITFESEILDGSDNAERSDGQWFHSKNNDVIHANIEIEYSNDNGATWTADTYATPADASDVTGVTTGGKAYFTNTEKNKDGNSYYGTRATGDVYSNNKEYFTFAAESSANYKFVGWYRKVTTVKNGVTTTNYYAITGDPQSPKTTNDTYVARFVPFTGGRLTVNNTLYTAGTYKGSGTTQVKLDVINSNSASAAAIYTTGFKNRTATIGQEYIVENSAKYVRITLKTIPSGIDTFQQFSYNDDGTIKTTGVETYFPDGGATAGTSYTLDGTTAVKTIIIPIADLFDEGEQTKNLLEYYSELNKWTLKYELKYFFNGREFGTGTDSQWYVVKGEFESNEFNTYVTEDSGHYHIARDFLSNKKPYERDFMKSITWNFDTASTANETGVVTDATNHTITYKWEIHQNDDQADTERKAIFTLPYCYNPNKDYSATDFVPVTKYQQRTGSTSGTKYYVFEKYFYTPGTDAADSDWTAYLAEVASWQDSTNASKYDSAYDSTNCPYGYTNGKPNAPAFTTTAVHDGIPIYDKANVPTFDRYTTYGKRFVLNDEYPAAGASEEAYKYVTAAPSVWKDNAVKYFSYWKITNNDGKEIAKCYALRFNFSAYDNYQIEAIYEGTKPGSNSEAGYSEPIGATISYLDDSRNQYNEGGKGSNSEPLANESGDVLFKDFAVAYTYNSEVFNTYTDKKVRVGVAIEWVKNGDNGALINDIDGTDMENYEEKYSGTESTAIANIKSKLLGSSSPNNIYIKPIASNIENDTGYKPLSDTTLIDNKNRLKYHYAVYNEANGTDYSTKYGVRLYRAYAYIMVDKNGDNDYADENEVAISAKPAYFTFNDVANRKSD